jgi:hypothetical protein
VSSQQALAVEEMRFVTVLSMWAPGSWFGIWWVTVPAVPHTARAFAQRVVPEQTVGFCALSVDFSLNGKCDPLAAGVA